jgi:hypothetical protein
MLASFIPPTSPASRHADTVHFATRRRGTAHLVWMLTLEQPAPRVVPLAAEHISPLFSSATSFFIQVQRQLLARESTLPSDHRCSRYIAGAYSSWGHIQQPQLCQLWCCLEGCRIQQAGLFTSSSFAGQARVTARKMPDGRVFQHTNAGRGASLLTGCARWREA